MKPSQKQVNILYHSLQSRYDNAKLKRISNEANVFANYLNTLSGFTTIDAPHEVKHVGRVIVDGVLQLASDWNRQVGGTVRYITGVLSAATVSGFISFVQQHQRQPQTQFKVKNRETALLMVAQFFAGKGIETFDSLYKWLEPESNRDSLLTQNSGLQWGVFRIGNKTADYFRGLVGHWDAVAVDRGIRELLAAAKVISKFSNKYDYKEIRSIVQLTAVSHFDSRPLDLDASIYSYYTLTRSGTAKVIRKTKISGSGSGNHKYCIYCGVSIPQIARYCPKCGGLQP